MEFIAGKRQPVQYTAVIYIFKYNNSAIPEDYCHSCSWKLLRLLFDSSSICWVFGLHQCTQGRQTLVLINETDSSLSSILCTSVFNSRGILLTEYKMKHSHLEEQSSCTRFLAFAVVQLRSLFFGHIPLCHWVIGALRFEAEWWEHFKMSNEK